MKNNKSHFVFSKSEQNGIFLLVGIIVVLQFSYFFIDFSSGTSFTREDEQRLEEFQKKIDSIKQTQASKKDNIKIFPFNPNYLTDFRGYALGMNPEQIDRLLAFRKEGKFVNSSEEFQKITGISDSLLIKISPYFKFPDWVSKRQNPSEGKSVINVAKNKKDFNSATTADLMALNGIGEVLAGRIINYRNKIGGFRGLIQLRDIYGLNYELRKIVEDNFRISEPTDTKLNLNTATVLQLAEIPYFGYELAREIVKYRTLHEGVSSFDELAQIKDFPSEKIDRIALYLTVN